MHPTLPTKSASTYYTVIYRIGGTERFAWRHAFIQKQADRGHESLTKMQHELTRAGYLAMIVPVDTDLPTTFEPVNRGCVFLGRTTYLAVTDATGVMITASTDQYRPHILRHSPYFEQLSKMGPSEYDTKCPLMPGKCWGSSSAVWDAQAHIALEERGREGLFEYMKSLLVG